VRYSKKSKKILKKAEPDIRDRLIKGIENRLALTPFYPGDKKLDKSIYWRRRIGKYRVLYSVNSDSSTLNIVEIFLRSDGYNGKG
jgi:mRNA-degrading endonuclease RelE of RelBE toxin-antitoxin system